MRRLALGLLVVLCLAVTSAARASSAFGNVDSPRSGATVYGVVAVQGWVLDVNAIDNIQVLVDGTCPNADVGGTCTADLNLPRVDVLNAFPTYAGSPTARPGFIGSFVTGSGAGQVSDGAHTVTVIATETDDPTNPVTIASIPVVVDTSINQPPFGWIDIPTTDPTVVEAANSAFPVVGWAIDDRSVDHIDFLVDGQIVAGAVCCNDTADPRSGSTASSASYGSTRPDVQAAFPGVEFSLYSGFWANIDSTSLLNGLHTITVRVTDSDGASRVIGTRTVDVENASLNLHPFGWVDFPLDESTIPDVVCEVDVPDSGCQVSPCPVTPPPTLTSLSLSNMSPVRGWVLDTGARLDFGQTGYVQLLIDGVIIADTRQNCVLIAGTPVNCYGLNRPDVEENYPGFVNSDNAGYQFGFNVVDNGTGNLAIYIPSISSTSATYPGVNVTTITAGKHDITVRAGDVAETVSQIGIPISVDFTTCQTTSLDRPGFGFVDTPNNYQFVDGTLDVVGWAFDPDGFSCSGANGSEVDIDIDGQIVGTAAWCGVRPDVPANDLRVPSTFHSTCFDGASWTAGLAEVGWSFELDTTKLANSPHDLNVYETDCGGNRTLVGRRKIVVFNQGNHGP